MSYAYLLADHPKFPKLLKNKSHYKRYAPLLEGVVSDLEDEELKSYVSEAKTLYRDGTSLGEEVDRIAEFRRENGIPSDWITTAFDISTYRDGSVKASFRPPSQFVEKDEDEVFEKPEYVPVAFKPTDPEEGNRPIIMVIPDLQIGYHRHDDGTWEPVHSPIFMAHLLATAEDLSILAQEQGRPFIIVNIGDFLDLPEFSKYPLTQAQIMTTNRSIATATSFNQALLHFCHEYYWFLGNHDERVRLHTNQVSPSLAAVRRPGEKYPVNSVEHYLDVEKHGIITVPYKEERMIDGITFTHGTKHGKAGENARNHLYDSTNVGCQVTGHNHKIELAYRTVWLHGEPSIIWYMNPGVGARPDGPIPRVSYRTDWTMGVGVIHAGVPSVWHFNHLTETLHKGTEVQGFSQVETFLKLVN